MTITIDVDPSGSGLVMRMGRGSSERLAHTGGDGFDVIGAPVGSVRLTFLRESGRVAAVRFDPVYLNLVLRRQPASR
jgi:hypothetical protein